MFIVENVYLVYRVPVNVKF